MTNPNNAVRVRARRNGRASVYEANAWAAPYSTGALTEALVSANGNGYVVVKGAEATPSVVIAKTADGYKIALDLASSVNLALTQPESDSQIAAVVAYTNDPTIVSSDSEETGSPSSCGLLAVYGTASSSPVVPSDVAIRAAITDDGADGAKAAYAVIATVLLDSNAAGISVDAVTNFLCTVEPDELAGGIFEITTTDPGEGVNLPANHFIAVVKE